MDAHPELAADFESRRGVIEGGDDTKRHLARLVDSTLLKAETTADHVRALCGEAVRYRFRAVCVPPSFAALARACTDREPEAAVRVGTVAGFPLGYTTTRAKVSEVRAAVRDGADEIDYVQNNGWVRDGNRAALAAEARALVEAAEGRLVKIILETSLLTDEQIAECARLSAQAGVHVIKTSTGLGSRGVTPHDIEIIVAVLAEIAAAGGPRHGIKASGGIRSAETALELVRLGATRLGTSSGAAIVEGSTGKGSY